MPQTSAIQRLLDLARQREVVRLSEILQCGISDQSVTRMVRTGQLERVGRGLYKVPDAPVSEHHDLVTVMARTEIAVVVLLSALRFHELGTQQPNEVWIQLPLKARVPKMDWPQLKVIRTRVDALFTEGVERHTIGGVEIRVTDPARTVVDCFKHRNQIGLDVCLEALKELLRRDRSVIARLYHYSQLTRVQRVMQPYLEAAL